MHPIAHRGFSARYTENTLLAFDKAIEAGAWMIETDIRLSRDGIPFIFHDDSLERLAGCPDSIETISSDEIKKIMLTNPRLGSLPPQPIPSLADTLKHINGAVGMILEIKYDPRTAAIIANAVEPLIANKLDWLEVSCFEDEILHSFHAINPSIRLHKLIDETSVLEDESFDLKYEFIYAFDIDIALLYHPKTQDLLSRTKVIFWTVNEQHNPRTFSQALGAMSNDPLALHERLSALPHAF